MSVFVSAIIKPQIRQIDIGEISVIDG